MKPQNMKKTLYSVSAFLMLSLGISLQIKAGIGQSMLNAFALILAEIFKLEIGTILNLLNMLFFILYLIIRRTHMNRRDIVQIVATIANGYLVNLFVYFLFDHLIIQSYFLRVLTFLFGLSLASLSLGAILAMEIIQFPLESLCIALGEKLKHKLTTVRMRFDIFFLLSTLLLTLVTKHNLYIREGTIISFFLLSRLMGFSYYFLKKRL
ncbi:YczE/YyaS/YitT family protein [Lachnoclostridium phytofermentans]|uniref:Membrane spanning protein n=1 Tax=Lachnoclostridium phytofermentans (strain ATCC 700394 / DSM 18823 / ISDg) TaxID=357809 RepID=A9KSA0_LACP7|nr:membrane protein [Lachnoclostridium phytofermentans]ABX42132.1 membrane spanning protein [Lachnoclostridium phytofermentans ISDg]